MQAAERDKPGVYQFEQVTVLGSAQESEVFVNPASVSVVGQEEIQQIAPQSVASYLRRVPGVQIIEEGVERISIRGEGSNRVAISIDGQKLSDHSGYGQPLLIDPASIERIEVLRGSSSVISGSRAIGGVVNIITKKGAEKPMEVTTSAGYFSATRGYRTSSSIAGSQDGFDYRLGFSRAELGDRQTANQRLTPSNNDDVNYSAHLGYTYGEPLRYLHWFGSLYRHRCGRYMRHLGIFILSKIVEYQTIPAWFNICIKKTFFIRKSHAS